MQRVNFLPAHTNDSTTDWTSNKKDEAEIRDGNFQIEYQKMKIINFGCKM